MKTTGLLANNEPPGSLMTEQFAQIRKQIRPTRVEFWKEPDLFRHTTSMKMLTIFIVMGMIATTAVCNPIT